VWVGREVGSDDVKRLNAMKEVKVQQRTPIRVLHRRSAMVREKVVHSMRVEGLTSQWLVVDMVTSSGTYVKEFVHSDRGRTVPSLASMMGGPCECVQLDVMELMHEE
jgi:tRNA pseudouridine synthase 10